MGVPREHRSAMDVAADEFAANYPALVQEAKLRLNGLFNQADYPRNVRERFSFATEISPIPTGPDFRVVSLHDAEIAEIKREIEDRKDQAVATAHQDLYRRMAERIGHMADKLGDSEAIFRDSLVENLRDLCELLPRLDLVGDPELTRIRRMAETKLLGVAPDTLRKDPDTRAQTARDASAILAAMGGLYNAGQ